MLPLLMSFTFLVAGQGLMIILQTLQVEHMNLFTTYSTKEKIKEIKGVDVENQKIICRGKHLTNGKNLTDFKVKENDCLILMVLKKVSFW